MNSEQDLKLAMTQVAERNARLEQMNAMRGRMQVGILSEGLQVLLLTARAGDQGAQTDLRTLRDLLQQVLDTSDVVPGVEGAAVEARMVLHRSPGSRW